MQLLSLPSALKIKTNVQWQATHDSRKTCDN
jgi:hypothetical protein